MPGFRVTASCRRKEHPVHQSLVPMFQVSVSLLFIASQSICYTLCTSSEWSQKTYHDSKIQLDRWLTAWCHTLWLSRQAWTQNSNRIPAPVHHRQLRCKTKTPKPKLLNRFQPVIIVMFLYFQVDPTLQVPHPRKSRKIAGSRYRQTCAMCVHCTLCSGVLYPNVGVGKE